jgi:peptidoglycan-N-acetylmuramic acid deacetylase
MNKPSFLRKNYPGFAALAFCCAAVLLAAALSPDRAALPAGSWGLSFQQEGSAPIGNATQEQLSAYGAAYLGDTGKPVIYLTFDAGYENGCTAKILDVLKAHHVTAAFFVVGNYIAQNPELVRRMVDEGHIVGNHTYHHCDMSKLSDQASFEKELTSLEDLYRETTGQKMQKFYRPPQGIYSEDNLKMAQALGYHTVFWSLAYVDWLQDDQPTSEEAFDKLIPRIHNGAIVLLHSTSQTNAEILDALLTRWEDLGYSFGTLNDLFQTQAPAETQSETT